MVEENLPPGQPEATEDDKWRIKTRWLDMTDLGKGAAIVLRLIQEEAHAGHISPVYKEIPKWRTHRLYEELLEEHMSQRDFNTAMRELHRKNILCLAFAYTPGPQYGSSAPILGPYKRPAPLYARIREIERSGDGKINLRNIEIYLVLPEDDTVIS